MEPDVTTIKSGPGLITYRAVVGAALGVILALLPAMGSDIRDTLRDTTRTLGAVQTNLATIQGRMDDMGQRVTHNENGIQTLSEKAGSLDNRVTVLEHRGHKDEHD